MILVIFGPAGTPTGVTESIFDVMPVPFALTAIIFMEYSCPFFNPDIVRGLVTDAGLRCIVVQLDPPLMEYAYL